MNGPPWFTGKALAFDTETTAPEPTEARLVTATAAEVSVLGLGRTWEWMINAGVDIPEEASKIHGISTAQVQATGRPMAEALVQIVATLTWAWRKGWAVIAMNANYDLTVLQCELARLGLPALQMGMVLDPFVIDRGCDPYRQGKRRLTETAAHYGVKLEGAHSATGDALAAARIVWAQAKLAMTSKRYQQLRSLTLLQMQSWQAKAHRDRQENYREYLIKKMKTDLTITLADVAKVDGSWPLRAVGT